MNKIDMQKIWKLTINDTVVKSVKKTVEKIILMKSQKLSQSKCAHVTHKDSLIPCHF